MKAHTGGGCRERTHRDDGFARIVCRLASVPVGLATTHGVGVVRVGLVADAGLVNEAVEVRAGVARSVDVAGGVTVLAVAALVDLVRVRSELGLWLGLS